MTIKMMKNVIRLVQVAVAACLVCCAPLVGSFLLGFAGAGGFVLGQWVIGGALVSAAIYLAAMRKTKACGCAASLHKGGDHCG